MSLIKVQFGCGGNRLDGWQNYDMEVDITKTLPFFDDSVDYIFCEHCIEHVTQREGFNFMQECFRILKAGATLRLATPDIAKMAQEETENYRKFIKGNGWGDGNPGCGFRAILFQHGHQNVYSKETMTSTLYAVGFRYIKYCDPGESEKADLQNLESHWRVIGKEFNNLETLCVEASKPNVP